MANLRPPVTPEDHIQGPEDAGRSSRGAGGKSIFATVPCRLNVASG
jgi:hypothetical protein